MLAEVLTAFVAFAVIVASVRVTLGDSLTPFEMLLVHFFTESGMLAASFPLLAIVLYQFWPDELKVATITTWYAFLLIMAYLVYYIRRRKKINAPTPLLSMLNIILWCVWVVILGVTLTQAYWLPSLALISALTLWGLFSAAMIFISFLSSFLSTKKPDST
ncbi:MAG: hypothetical protein EX260_11705 [Desulfobulbaceae bacterium]|nr:MAG: hypothetical protein EX260_11705 [Desulfobulbaceae bacterium]